MNDVFAKGDVDIVTVGREQPRGLTYSSIRRGELEDRKTRDTASWLVSCLVVTYSTELFAFALLFACWWRVASLTQHCLSPPDPSLPFHGYSKLQTERQL